ncbi:unnamed protein product [Caenorhabditis angaria]|uniref:Uncharacterized protein n=1 Tax=Caenorhabditis angaria TaxID=860376 RepID=A0A9P1IPB6_9PELO|nr:unnamed protein product [Caenorhabditis angaria]
MNRSDSEMSTDSDWFDRLYILETILIIWSYLECGLYFLVLFKTNHYHPNLIFMLKHLIGQYFFSMAFRLMQIWCQYGNRNDELLLTSHFFQFASIGRSTLVFIAFSFSTFVMIERLCATCYKTDYEKHPRLYIGYMLTIFLYSWAILNNIVFVFEYIHVIYHVIFLFAINTFAFLACLFNEHYNNKYFMIDRFSSENMVVYSLSERYQVLENVKTAHLFKRGIILNSFFSILCVIFLIGNKMSISNWLHIGFNYMAILYGIGFPAAMLYFDEKWRKHAKRYLKMLMCAHRTSPLNIESNASTPTNAPKTDILADTNVYFENLKNDWDNRIPRKI